MRLWHHKLIPCLPRRQLLGQHRECCALRGKGWGRKHATVDYVFRYPPGKLYAYHRLVMTEMGSRMYRIENEQWWIPAYRGKNQPPWESGELGNDGGPYPEHDDAYLKECLENLRGKGIVLDESHVHLIPRKSKEDES